MGEKGGHSIRAHLPNKICVVVEDVRWFSARRHGLIRCEVAKDGGFSVDFLGEKQKLRCVSFFQKRKPNSAEDIDVPRFCKGRMNNSAHQNPLLCSFSGIERK